MSVAKLPIWSAAFYNTLKNLRVFSSVLKTQKLSKSEKSRLSLSGSKLLLTLCQDCFYFDSITILCLNNLTLF